MIGAGGVLAPAPTLPPGMLFWVTCLERGAPDLEGNGRADLGITAPNLHPRGGWFPSAIFLHPQTRTGLAALPLPLAPPAHRPRS